MDYPEEMRVIFVIFTVISSVLPLASQEKSFPPEKEGKHFHSKQISSVKGSAITLLPKSSQSSLIRKEAEAFAPDYSIEILYHMPLPEDEMEEDLMKRLYNELSQVRRLKGAFYFSGRRQKMYPLIEESYLVSAIKSMQPIEDPFFDLIPTDREGISFQKDTTFGKVWYHLRYRTTKDSIVLTVTNQTPVRYLFIPVIDKMGMRSVTFVFPRGNDLIFYSLTQLHTKSFLGIKRTREEYQQSFDHRVSAFQGRFAEGIYLRNEGSYQ